MATITNKDYIVKIKPQLMKYKDITDMTDFEWAKAITNYEKLETRNNSMIKQILNRSIPRELLLYFNGNPINNTFSHLFNFNTSNIYTDVKPKNISNQINKVAFGLMTFALIMFGSALIYSLFAGQVNYSIVYFK
jgi:hypothetical protein